MQATNRQTDVLIIGGGIIGCAIALRVAQSGRTVTVVERGELGREASWSGAGIILPGSHARTDELARMRRRSITRYGAWIGELRELSGIDPEYVECGSLDLITDDNQDAAADREVRAAGDTRTGAGLPLVERLDRRRTLELEPALHPKIRGALLIRDAVQVRNPRLMSALTAACARVGVRFLMHTPVRELWIENGRVRGVVTSTALPGGEPLAADQVVLAAGAWSSTLGSRVAELVPVRPVRGQIVLLERRPPCLRHIISHGKTYLVCRRDGMTIVGSTEEHDSGFDTSNTAHGVGSLLQLAEYFVPELKQARLVTTWAGLRPGTPDGKPHIGPVPGIGGLFAATGHFRSGLTLAPLTADVIAQLLAGRPAECDLDPFRPGRLRTEP